MKHDLFNGFLLVFQARHLVKEKEKIDDYVKKQIEKHKVNYNPSETRDFIDIYLHHLYNNSERDIPGKYSKEIILYVCQKDTRHI